MLPPARPAHPISDPRAVRRVTRLVTFLDDLSGFSTQRGNNVNATASAIRTKHDTPAVRREGRFVVVGRIMRHADGFAAGNLLHPDVELPFAGAVGGVSHELAIRGKRRLIGE